MRIFIGWDQREERAYRVAVRSLARYCDVQPVPLKIDRLISQGLLNRPIDRRGAWYDFASGANVSTEFSASRFLVPILAQTGWALFVDCDVIFYDNPLHLLEYADETKAVMVVKHNHCETGTKMAGQVQSTYPRKNWSSVMLFNCDHPSNQRLSLWDVQERPGRDLHRFYWLDDSEVGALPEEWNWLVNVQPRPMDVKIAHFTKGGPWLENWNRQPYDEEWLRVESA